MYSTREIITCPHLRGTFEHKVSCLAGLWHIDCKKCTRKDKVVVINEMKVVYGNKNQA